MLFISVSLFLEFWAFGHEPAFLYYNVHVQVIMLLDCTCHFCNFVKLTVQWLSTCMHFSCALFYCFLLLFLIGGDLDEYH